jgi:integrase
MGRPNKIWFRKDLGWWMVTLGGQKIRLAEGRENKKAAQGKFYELASARTRAPESTSARVADIIEAFLAWAKLHLSDQTLHNYTWYGQLFAEAFGYLAVAELRPIHVTRWVDAHCWGPTTEYNARRSVKRAFSWACEQGILATNPLRGMKSPKPRSRERALTDTEYKVLIANSRRDFRILLFALKETGCRPKEARTLQWSQVKEDRWVLPKHKTVHKTGRPRTIFLTKPMQKLMAILRKDSTSDYVFLNSRGRPWTVNAIRLRISRIKDKADLPKDVCAYLLRHAFGTNAILNGVDPVTLAQLMGHESLEMISKVYCHLADQRKHLQEAVERIRQRGPAAAKPRQAAASQGV